MHEAMMAQMGMGNEHNGSPQENYGTHHHGQNGDWTVEMSPQYSSHHQSPIHEYNGYSFIQPAPQSMPHETSYTRMAPPPNGPHHHHQQLLPLIMPSHPTWPSMLTNPAAGYSQPLPILPPYLPLKTSRLPSIHSNPSPRKTLSDADRRRMCQYHEDNPTTKQTEIGAMFGVERSTVSKVLRNKEKYLATEDRCSSPVKRSKGKYPDIERALSSWVQKSQSKGIPMTDAVIKEKAQFFASAVGSSDSHAKANSSSWLEKFKQKNGLGMGRLMRRASETNISDHASNFLRPDSVGASISAAQSPTLGVSPTSPEGLSPSPLSASKSIESIRADSETMDCYLDFSSNHGLKQHSQSATSLSSSAAFTEHSANSSFSGGPTTPTTPFPFSPNNENQFLGSQSHLPLPSNHFQRPRSQTFPNLGIDESFMSSVENENLITPKYLGSNNPENHQQQPQPLGSPIHEMSGSQQSFSPILHHSSSSSSMSMGPPYSTPLTTASPSTNSLPGSPTREDAKRALDTLLSFFNGGAPPGFVNEAEYMTVVRLTEKLRLSQGAQGGGKEGMGPGGLHRIVELEGEVMKVEQLGSNA